MPTSQPAVPLRVANRMKFRERRGQVARPDPSAAAAKHVLIAWRAGRVTVVKQTDDAVATHGPADRLTESAR